MSRLRSLITCREGATVTEFALLAPIFFLLLLGTIEGSRLVWTQQTLDEVAYSTARCISVSVDCDTSAKQKDYAVTRAGNYGIAVVQASVVPEASGTCNGFADSSVVTISHTFNSVIDGFIPLFPATLTSEGCYPTLS